MPVLVEVQGPDQEATAHRQVLGSREWTLWAEPGQYIIGTAAGVGVCGVEWSEEESQNPCKRS